MFGDFIKLYRAGLVNELGNLEALRQLIPGSPVVALSEPEALQNGSLGRTMFFAITSDAPGMLIAQQVSGDTEEDVKFSVQEFPAEETLRYYTYQLAEVTPHEVLQRAKSRIGECSCDLRSYPGDDFVEECLTGLSVSEIYAQQPVEAGQHWWTPLDVTAKQILEELQDAIQQEVTTTPDGESFIQKARRKVVNEQLKKVTDSIQNVAPDGLMNIPLSQLEHHAILIEGEQSVIFADGAIRHLPKRDFCNMTPNTPLGGPAKGTAQGKDESEQRLLARNRAIFKLCRDGIAPGEWGAFNLLLNNSEHFCRYCRNGKPSCTQLRDKSLIALKRILGMILPGWLAFGVDIVIEKFFPTTPGEHGSCN